MCAIACFVSALRVKPVSLAAKVREKLVAMKKGCAGQEERFQAAAATMLKLVGNVAAHPAEAKYRDIKLSNAAIQQRVGSVPGAVEVLEAMGFERAEGGDVLHMADDKADPTALNLLGGEIQNAITNQFFGVL